MSFSSSVSGGTPPYTYYWQLSGLATATTPTASLTYTERGSYTVGLTVTDSKGVSTSATPLYITVLPVLYNNTVEVSTGVDLPGLGNYEGVEYSFTVPTVGPAPDAINVSIAGSV